jgi:hypothetical protein
MSRLGGRALRPGLLALALLGGCGDRERPRFGDEPRRPLDVRAELSASEVPLLGRAELVVDLFHAAGAKPELRLEPVDGLTVEAGPVVHRGWADGSWARHRFTLRPARLGELQLPPVTARHGEATASSGDELRLQVTTRLAGADAAVEAPAPPFPPRADLLAAWPYAALALLALAAWLAFRRLRGRRAAETRQTPLPPHTRALRELARLRQAPRITAAQIERFHVELSAILRRYVEERFGLHAPERTTEEFLAEAERSPVLAPEQRVALRAFLEHCDLVKFAQHRPDERAQLDAFATAEQFVEATRGDRVQPLGGAA